MIITYYGAFCFKVQSGETVIAFNPPSKESEYKSPRFSADIVLISVNHKDYNGWSELSGKNGAKPFVIEGGGEYEIGGVNVRGINADKFNTIYALSFEDISLCHLGAFGGTLSPEQKEEIGKIDILFIPIAAPDMPDGSRGGREQGEFLDAPKAAQIAAGIEPRIVVPMRYETAQLKKFLKEFGSEEIKSSDKLTLKKKDLAEAKTEVVILEPVV